MEWVRTSGSLADSCLLQQPEALPEHKLQGHHEADALNAALSSRLCGVQKNAAPGLKAAPLALKPTSFPHPSAASKRVGGEMASQRSSRE